MYQGVCYLEPWLQGSGVILKSSYTSGYILLSSLWSFFCEVCGHCSAKFVDILL